MRSDSPEQPEGPVQYDPVPLPSPEPDPDRSGPINVFLSHDAIDSTSGEEANPKQSFLRQKAAYFRPAYILDHLDRRSWKTVIVTWLQVWLTVILLVVPRTSHWMGTAAYLLQVMGFVGAAGGNLVIINVLMACASLSFSLFAWLVATISMAITTHLRGWPTPETLATQLVSEGVCNRANLTACVLQQVFSGRFLETRCLAVFIFAIIIGTTILGLALSFHKLMRVPFIAGIISLTILCCYNAFFPVFQPLTVGLLVIKPMGIACALRVVLAAVVFPSTSSYRYVSGAKGVMDSLVALNECNQRFLLSMKPSASNFARYAQAGAQITAIRAKLPALELFLRTAQFEVSFGRLDSGDLGEFRAHLKNLINYAAGYSNFYQLFQERVFLATNLSSRNRSSSVVSTADSRVKLLSTLYSSYRPEKKDPERIGQFISRRMSVASMTDRVPLSELDRIAQAISEDAEPLLETVMFSHKAIVDWLTAANSFRIYTVFFPSVFRKHQEKQKSRHRSILEAQARIMSDFQLLRDYSKRQERLVQLSKNEELILCYLSQSSLLLFMVKLQFQSLLKIIDLFLAIDKHRPVPRLISFLTISLHDNAQNFEPSEELPEDFSSNNTTLSRDPDALPLSSRWHAFGKKVVRAYELSMNKHLWFWIRSGVLICVCAAPYFSRTTAAWCYENRIIWLPVLCAVSTAEYTGETIYVYFTKIVYSAFGALLGLLGWYISAGSGKGNYYGYCAVTAVIYLILAFYKHFSVHATPTPAIMACITTVLVMGTSWITAQYDSISKVGYGWRVAVTRLLSVLGGLSVSMLASCIPRPNSSKEKVRRCLSTALEEIGNLHCNVSSFAYKRFQVPEFHAFARHNALLDKFRSILITLARVKGFLHPLQYEVPITGPWPTQSYKRLQELLNDIIQLYFFLFSIFNSVQDPEEWIPNMLDRIGWTDESLNAKVFAVVHMTSSSLRTKKELPRITLANLSMRHMELLRAQWGIADVSLSERFYHTEAENSNESLKNGLDFSRLFGEDGQLDAVALLLAHMIYQRIDEVILVIKGLVGEKYDFNVAIFEEQGGKVKGE